MARNSNPLDHFGTLFPLSLKLRNSILISACNYELPYVAHFKVAEVVQLLGRGRVDLLDGHLANEDGLLEDEELARSHLRFLEDMPAPVAGRLLAFQQQTLGSDVTLE